MELKKEDIQILRTKSKASSQVTFDVDYNVPDVKPDIGRMIQNKGEMTVEEVRLNEGHAFLKGKLQADLLYVGEEDGRIYSLSANLPMEETLNLDGIVNGDKMCLKWEIEDLSIHIIHSRKMNIKAVVTFFASVDELTGVRLPVSLDDETVSVQKKTMRVLSLVIHKKDTMRLKEEITLVSNKPNIAELLWYTTEVRGLDLRPEENSVKAKGELFIFALYTGDDESGTLQWIEHSIPFNGEVECSGCISEMIPNLEAAVINQTLEVKPDADGEERKLQADVVLELDMKLYREEEHDVIMDAYTPFRQYQTKGRPEMLESLLIRNFSRCRLSDRVTIRETQGKILQICHSQGDVKVDKTQIVSDGIQALSSLLQNTLTNKNEYITVQEELENLENYFAILRIRYAGSFEYSFHVEEDELLSCLVPKLILQPLAENSVMHGSSDNGTVMEIQITCWRENKDVMIELSDDGKGFEVTDDALAPHPERKRIGVANVNDRIQLNFGRKYGLKINSQPGKGTTCTLTLPELYADTLS